MMMMMMIIFSIINTTVEVNIKSKITLFTLVMHIPGLSVINLCLSKQ